MHPKKRLFEAIMIDGKSNIPYNIITSVDNSYQVVRKIEKNEKNKNKRPCIRVPTIEHRYC